MRNRTAVTFVTSAAALLLAAGPAVTAVSNGKYRGETVEGEVDFSLKVKNGKVAKVETIVFGYCGSTYLGIITVYPPSHGGSPIKVKSNGTFKTTFQADDTLPEEDDKRVISGKFQGDSVSGDVKIEGICSGEDSFEASR